jgi:hypothetical protein
MPNLQRKMLQPRTQDIVVSHIEPATPRRAEAEGFIRAVFARHYGAAVSSFAPHLLLLEQQERIVAATGWRAARAETLFLERYLDMPVELAMAQLANESVARGRIVEVGNLAAEKPGGSIHVILALAAHLDRLGYEWVVFTATQELIGIFARLGLPLLALSKTDPARLGAEARAWGRYYETGPIVVAGRIRLALERMGRAA